MLARGGRAGQIHTVPQLPALVWAAQGADRSAVFADLAQNCLFRGSATELTCATQQAAAEFVLRVAKSSLLAKEELSISLEAVLRCDLPCCPTTQCETLPLAHTDHARAISVR